MTQISKWHPGRILRPIKAARARGTNFYMVGLIALSAVFWLLRVGYWNTHTEEPFSDLLGYVMTADNIAGKFYFGVEPARPVYYTPITPLAIAIAKLISPENYLWWFRYLMQLLTFAGAVALVRELALMTRSRWLGLAFLFVLAISRSSIFWSLKPATETVCEALLYLSAALALATARKRSLGLALLCGVVCLALGLNRPNFIVGAMIVSLAFIIREDREMKRPESVGLRKRSWWKVNPAFKLDYRGLALMVVFLIGFFGSWSIWIGRNLINYGMFIPTSSSGLITAHWDYGGGPIRIGRYTALKLADGSEYKEFGINKLIIAADSIPGEKERVAWLGLLTKAWYAENLVDLPRVILWRLKHYITTRGASGLTKVSREEIFEAQTRGYNNSFGSAAWLNLILLDKTPTVCLLGLLGLVIIMWTAPTASPIFLGLALMPWLSGALVLGYERTVESLIPMTIWLALFGVAKTILRIQSLEQFAKPRSGVSK